MDALDLLADGYVGAGLCTPRVGRCFAAEALLLQTYDDFLVNNDKDHRLATQLLVSPACCDACAAECVAQ